jgi:hypothetical protein
MSSTIFRDSILLAGTVGGFRFERENRTERDVEIPPAYLITDADGAAWSLGTLYIQHKNTFEFNVIRNDVDLDEYASRIVYRQGRVWIFGRDGWRVWTRGKYFL